MLIFLSPKGTSVFWLTLAAAIGMLATQVVFWIVTQPVNRVWLNDVALGSAGSTFFSFSPAGHMADGGSAAGWKRFRDRWEYSHLVRAVLIFASFLSLLLALASSH